MAWVMVFFDLPVGTPEERRDAANFRKDLVKDGYFMVQFSVYARPCGTADRVETQVRRLKSKIPAKGSEGCTLDAQWGRMIVMRSQQKSGLRENAGADDVLLKTNGADFVSAVQTRFIVLLRLLSGWAPWVTFQCDRIPTYESARQGWSSPLFYSAHFSPSSQFGIPGRGQSQEHKFELSLASLDGGNPKPNDHWCSGAWHPGRGAIPNLCVNVCAAWIEVCIPLDGGNPKPLPLAKLWHPLDGGNPKRLGRWLLEKLASRTGAIPNCEQ